MGVGAPEYILLLRKLPTDRANAYADIPVTKTKEEYTRGHWQIDAHAFERSSGDRLVTLDEVRNASRKTLTRIWGEYNKTHVYDYDEHVKICEEMDRQGKLSSTYMMMGVRAWDDEYVWDDISRVKTLNLKQRNSRKQAHICPLQIDIVERIINRYSNPGEVVYDPFAGIFTVPYMAIKMGRYGHGVELNSEYWADGVDYCQNAEMDLEQPTLFDFMEAAT
jgi:hypothetical protein